MRMSDYQVPATFDEALQNMMDRLRLEGAVLASSDGLPIATVPSAYDPETAAAMVALLQSVSHEAHDQLGVSGVDEVTVVGRDRRRLVCRRLQIDGEELVLALMVPANRYYRRISNRAIKEIKAVW
jgi:predicted regulator of Ras-like GTPase activity (Roadblock/LC7/MglB family)